MSGWPRDELVEARADFILTGAHTAKAFAEHFEAQMQGGEFEARMRPGTFEARVYRGKARKLLASLQVFRSKGADVAEDGLVGQLHDSTGRAPGYESSRMRPAAIQATAMVGAWVLPATWTGKTEASTIRSPVTPRTRSWGSTTSSVSGPMALAPTAW